MFLLRRLAQLVGVLLAVTFLSLAALTAIGDPLVNIVGVAAAVEATYDCDQVLDETGGLTGAIQIPDGARYTNSDVSHCREVVEAKEQFHLDDPLMSRYVRYLGDVVRGDLGRSFIDQERVRTIVATALPKTLLLVGFAQVIAVGLAVPWGVASAYRANRPSDKISTGISFGFIAIPNFAFGVILLYLFAVNWEIFPLAYDDHNVITRLNSLVLPAATLGLPLAASYQRLLRTDLLTTLQEDYVSMARAKGLPDRWVMMRHALRPSLSSIVTVFGINTGALLAGSLVVERVFDINGIGKTVSEAAVADDFPVVLAIVLIVSAGFVIMNVLVDVLYSFIDPRIRAR